MIEQIWSKSRNLEILTQNGFQVPPFVLLTCNQVKEIDRNLFDWGNFIQSLKQNWCWNKLVVRSSALSEDGEISSEAWKYATILDISVDDIKNATLQVIEKYKKVTQASVVSWLSIIIQQFIWGEISWVTFTRTPERDRNMLIEYAYTRWDILVWGEIVPQIARAYRFWKNRLPLENGEEYIDIWWKIEELFDSPMDIEWCISKWELFILQARPITTISRNEFESYLLMDSELMWKQDFYYMVWMATEMTPNPTPFTMSLLEKFMSNWWPLDIFYKKHHIYYNNPEYFSTFGNQLYIEKYKEKLQFQWWGWWRYFRNKIFLLLLRPEKRENLRKEIQRIQNRNIKNFSLSELLSSFLEDYCIIYSINFSAWVYQNIAEKLKLNPTFKSSHIKIKWLIGNSLEIADESEWKSFTWWDIEMIDNGLYGELSKKISEYLSFREIWRSIVVWYISTIRKVLQKISQDNNVSDYHDLYFLTIDEVLEWKIDQEIMQSRKIMYEKNKKYTFPPIISSDFIQKNEKSNLIWASWSSIKWTLVLAENIDDFPRPVILFTRFLSPDIVAYFDRIDGIISQNGWSLSHLAIVARERWIPVLIDEKVLEKYRIWDILTLNK